MSELKVEKQAVDAQVLLTDGSQIDGSLFLSPLSRSHEGPQTVLDLMEEAGQVLPFRKTDGGFTLLGTATIAAVRLAGEAGSDTEFLDRIPVQVRLQGNHQVSGNFLSEQGAGERISSVLDNPSEWFRVEQDYSCYWIIKRHLLTLEPQDA